MDYSIVDLQNLTAKQKRAIPLIFTGKSISEGCTAAGISRDTFYTWYQMPAFRSEFARQRAILIEESFSGLQASLTDAVSTLQRLLNAKGKKGESIQFKASQAIIENMLRLVEIQSLQDRIASLEVIINK